MQVPVLDSRKLPLMPTSPARARLLLKQGKASAYWNKLGIFCILLKKEVAPDNQQIAVGIDPGSRFEGWSAVGNRHTILNGISEAVTHVKDAMKVRRNMRRSRRYRKPWRREARFDNRLRNKDSLPPSTHARWNAKLRILVQLRKIENLGIRLHLKHGYETKELRENFGLKKTSQKDNKTFSSHAVDAWVMAASITGALRPSWTGLFYWIPIRLHRRQLHRFEPDKSGIRRPYGGTRSMGLTRGTLVRHIMYGLTYIGGTSDGRVSLHSLATGKRLTQKARLEDITILTRLPWRSTLLSGMKAGVSATPAPRGIL